MSDIPRKDDIVIAADGTQRRVVSVASETVRCVHAPLFSHGKAKQSTHRLRNLECLDHDEGLWAEIA